MDKVIQVVKERLSERDTKTVLGSVIYTIARPAIPPEYGVVADSIAGLLGLYIMGTPNNSK